MIIKNSIYNILGLGLPLIVAVFTIPFLIESLGDVKFGLLTLIWVVVSYFGLFDLGLGRALTLEVSVIRRNLELNKLPSVIGTSYAVLLLLGVLSSLLMLYLAPFGTDLIDDVSDREEVLRTIYAMALAVPFVIIASGSRGILEAYHSFGVVNVIRLPMGVLTFLGPVWVIWLFGARLDYIAVFLLFVRIFGTLLYFLYAKKCIIRKYRSMSFDSSVIPSLLTNGGWMTVSNILGPFMGYIDRFIIVAIVGAAAVAYYATPSEIVTKLWIIPGAITAVLFPVMAASRISDDGSYRDLYTKSVMTIFYLMLPLAAVLMLLSTEILSIWISEEFASKSDYVLILISAGFIFNSLATIPFTLIQSHGHSKVTAVIHLFELPIFIFFLWWFIYEFGYIGAAIAFAIRMFFDTFLMFYFAEKITCAAFGIRFYLSLLAYLFSVIIILITSFYGGIEIRLVMLVSILIFSTFFLSPLMPLKGRVS